MLCSLCISKEKEFNQLLTAARDGDANAVKELIHTKYIDTNITDQSVSVHV